MPEITRTLHEYYVDALTDDGHVIHDLSYFTNTAAAGKVGWDIYSNNGDCDLFIGFDNINIPQGSTIISAKLRFNWYAVWNGYVETEIYTNIDYNIPTSYSEFTSMTPSDNYINVHQDPNTEEQISIYDVTEMIQELIDRGDWEELNAIVFYTNNTQKETSDSGADIDPAEYNPTASQLAIVFEPPAQTTLNDIFDNSRNEYFEYEKLSLDDNGEYVHSEYLDEKVHPGGDININFDRDIIGSINLNLVDNSGMNFISDLIRPWYCVNYNDEIYKFPLGTYFLFSPKKQSDGNFVECPAYGYDMLYALEQDKINASVTYDAGDTVTDIIYDILDNVGSWVKYNIPESTETLAEDASYEIGRSKLFVINSLLNKINYYPLWSSGLGVYCSIPWSDVYNVNWDFIDNENNLYVPGVLNGLNYMTVCNKVIIIARQLTADTEPLYKVLTFEDIDLEDHPISYTSIGRYITKVFYSEATSQSYVDLRAERELRKMLEIEKSVTFKHAFVSGRFGDGIPHQGDCYYFENELLEIGHYYKIENMKMFLDTGKLVNSTIRRVIYS